MMRNPIQAMIQNQLASFQEGLAEAMEQLSAAEMEGSAGGGAVKVKITGMGEVTAVRIDPQVVDPEDVELLQDLVCAAVREALRKASELKRERIMSSTPLGSLGVDLPDIF